MLAQTIQEQQAFQEFFAPTGPVKDKMWIVNDRDFRAGAEERFLSSESHLVSQLCESGYDGMLCTAPIPRGLLNFMEAAVKKFNVASSRFLSLSEVASAVLAYLDFTDPYYLLLDAPVSLTTDKYLYTYRLKDKDRTLLDPEKIECFKVRVGWDFAQYKKSTEFLNHPMCRQILSGQKILSSGGNRYLSCEDILDKISEMLTGSVDTISVQTEEWLYDTYESIRRRIAKDPTAHDETLQDLEMLEKNDRNYMYVAAVAAFLWFKSPSSLKYLISYHDIYRELLSWDHEKDCPVVNAYTGGEAIVKEWTVYTHVDLDVDKNTPPGSCINCGQELHCTRLVNTRAVTNDRCSCGLPVDPMDTRMHNHSSYSGSDCAPYLRAHNPKIEFVCYRCFQSKSQEVASEKKGDVSGINFAQALMCSRWNTCPNTECFFHRGKYAYKETLRKNRVMMLPQHQAK